MSKTLTQLERAEREFQTCFSLLSEAQKEAGKDLAKYRAAEDLPRHGIYKLLKVSPTRILNMEKGLNLTSKECVKYKEAVDSLIAKRNREGKNPKPKKPRVQKPLTPAEASRRRIRLAALRHLRWAKKPARANKTP